MLKNEGENLRNRESEYRKFAYTPEFREWLGSYPGLIKKVREIMRSQELMDAKMGDVFEFEEKFGEKEVKLKIEIRKNVLDGDNAFYHLKLDVDGQKFFVKSEVWEHRGKGHEEITNSEDARKRLQEIPWVDTVEYKMGYQDDNNQTFFVSEWVKHPMLRDYMEELRKKIADLRYEHDKESPDKSDKEWEEEERKLNELRELKKEIDDKVKTIQEILPEFHDLLPQNMFYDEETGKIYLFDLFTENQDLWGDW